MQSSVANTMQHVRDKGYALTMNDSRHGFDQDFIAAMMDVAKLINVDLRWVSRKRTDGMTTVMFIDKKQVRRCERIKTQTSIFTHAGLRVLSRWPDAGFAEQVRRMCMLKRFKNVMM